MRSLSVLFLIQNFDIKRYEDCAGYREVVKPMLASGLVSDHAVSFHEYSHRKIEPLLKQRLAQYREKLNGKPVVIYGAGLHTEYLMGLMDGFNVVAIADREVSLHGSKRFDKPVIAPAQINEYAQSVIISSRAFEQAIKQDLSAVLPETSTVLPLYENLFDKQLWFEEIAASVKTAVTDLEPDVLFYLPSHPEENLPGNHFNELKKLNPQLKIVTLWWDYDDQSIDNSYMKFERESLLYSDLVIENTNMSRITEIRARRENYRHHEEGEKIIFLPTIPDPELFRPVSCSEDKHYDIAIFGSSAGSRGEWIRYLTERYGKRFHHIGGVSQGDETLPMSDYAQAMARTKIAINTQTYPFRKQCKGKVREALSCGTFLLEEDNEETRAFYGEQPGIAYFKSEQELSDLIDQYESSQAWQDESEAGHRWLAEYYNAEVWTRSLLSVLFNDIEAPDAGDFLRKQCGIGEGRSCAF